MRISIKSLVAMKACHDGLEWFRRQKNKEAKYVLRELVKEKHFSWANWYVTNNMTHPQNVLYACFNAEMCIKNYEAYYPNDNRPRKAIETAMVWALNPTEENRLAAESAWSAAWSAAESAESAAKSAWSAAESAAESAESAAKSAWLAAWSAAESAESAAKSAWSAAWSAAESAAKSAAKSAAWSAAIEKAIELLGL